MKSNNLGRLAALAAAAAMLTLPVAARTRKGEKWLKEGQRLEAAQQLDEALEMYEQALATDPADPAYIMRVKQLRFQAGQRHVGNGQKARDKGDLEAALKEFQQALLRDPGSAIALQEWKRTTLMLEAEKNGKKLEGAERGTTPADRVRKQADERAASMLGVPELKQISPIRVPLKMNNQPPKVLYETVGKLAGVNVIFDPSFQGGSKNFNLELTNSSLEQALDTLAVLTKTFWKPISENTIFVTEDNITKRRDYEDNVVRVFYVQNATSTQDFQELATIVRTIVEARRVYTSNAQHTIVVRGTPDQVALVEKLLHDLDKPKAEVIVDVLVMEANSSKTRTLAAQIGTSNGLNLPISFTPRSSIGSTTSSSSTGTTPTTTTSTSTAVNLTNLHKVQLADYSTTLPGALLNLIASDRQTRVLQSPQVRASDGQKVTLKIGNKIPFITGSMSSGVGGISAMPYATTQFQFADVGVNLDITPTVHGRDEVTLKMTIEVSNVSDHVTIGGLEQPVIGQRRTETELRMREGEVNLLSGLSQESNTRGVSGIPGLINLPILGRLLGGENTDRERGELLIAVIPHIVRTPDITETDVRAVAAGADQVVKVNYAPKPAPTETPAAPPPAQPSAPTPTATPATPAPATTTPAVQGVPAAPGGPQLVFVGDQQVALGSSFNLALRADNVQDLFSASPIRVKWDPRILRLNEMAPGELMTRDGQRVTNAKDIRNDSGEAWITMNRLPGAGGVSGTGPLASLSFSAIGAGTSKVTVTEFGLRNNQLQPITVTGPETAVTVR